MKQYNLSDYLKLPTNEVLKIKLKAENEYIFGRIASAGMICKPTKTPLNNGVFGHLNKINNIEDYILDKSLYKDFSIIPIDSSQIESIEILNTLKV
jgi:hypothetical protein